MRVEGRLVLITCLAAFGCARPEAAARPSTPGTPAATHHDGSVPVSGGTLAVSEDGELALVSVPDRDLIYLVEVADELRVRAVAALAPHDEPGRAAEDAHGSFHVALRGAGALLTLDRDGEVKRRRPACPAPRGVATDRERGLVHVACAGGALLTYGPNQRAPRRLLRVAPDLRDVIVDHENVHVSRFRAAEILTIDPDGHLIGRGSPARLDLDIRPRFRAPDPHRTFSPNVAWRMVRDPARAALLLTHQRAADFPVDLEVEAEDPPPMRYGGSTPATMAGCPPGISHASLTSFSLDAPVLSGGAGRRLGPPVQNYRPEGGAVLGRGLLPVDVAPSPDGRLIALAFASSGARPFEQLVVAERRDVVRGGCAGVMRQPGMRSALDFRQPVAVAWNGPRQLLVQYRLPPTLVRYSGPSLREVTVLRLEGDRTPGRGDEIFNEGTPSNLACATCHPEGGDDGHVWNLGALGGRRRTQNLLGGVTETAPFHWAGDLDSLDTLVDEVFVARMGGRRLSGVEIDSLDHFLSHMPAPPRAAIIDADGARRGRAVFTRLACDECHSGPRLTDGRSHDVGTGESLQTPALTGLAARPPYLHDGRARTLAERFTAGHTEGHGDLSALARTELEDLLTYLRAL